jgi:predicted MPP superfamily phosphohydrolase
MFRLLHLSDIHFRGYQPPWDDDEDQRNELILDVRRLVDEGGVVDGIIVGGDIAFSGQPDEYAKARQWLESLVEASQCPESAVWMVPGNHDIDRGIVEKSEIIAGFCEAMRTCAVEEIASTLRRRLYGDPASATLVEHLRAYNEFARLRGCAVRASCPHWEDRVELDGEPALLWGLNSVVCSDSTDCGHPWGEPTQFLGDQQAKIPRNGGKVRIAICHHPPGWLRDWARVESYIARAHLVLFGHMHTAAVDQDCPGAPVHIHAGAVGPDEGEDWVPTYNLLTLTLDGDQLRVAIQPRIWDSAGTCFGPATNGIDERYVDLSEPISQVGEQIDEEVRPALATPLLDISSEAAAMSEAPAQLRELAFRYLSLPVTRRLEIADKLGVLDEVGDGDPFPEILLRVRDRDLIAQLAKELAL